MTDNSKPAGERGDDSRDAEARRRIADELDQNFMVEAAAGTGKTTAIINRMVNLVATGVCEIENLVAVTFTRKAAAELRERFQAALRSQAVILLDDDSPQQRAMGLRLQSASDRVSRAFVGTIHSFCATLLRERPIEFGVDPVFRELDEEEDGQLRRQAWQENLNDLFASGDPLIDQIDELGLDRKDLQSCFDRFIAYRDVQHWPCDATDEIDLSDIQQRTRDYIDRMKALLPLFPEARGNDKLMRRYEEIVRASDRSWNRLDRFFRLLEKFDTSSSAVQNKWHDKTIGKQEKDRWEEFRAEVAGPALQWWCRRRYRFVVEIVRRAVGVYQRQKAASRGIDFTDLLLIASAGLRTQPKLREYFQSRHTHLLVDEFQDTDPIQAEMILYLASQNVDQSEWHLCRPRTGTLFLVGDPKQSIYRFRRGDIVTYNRVKSIFEQSGGEVLSLVKNFRSRDEIRRWNNRVFSEKFLAQADQYTTAAEDMVQGRVDECEGDLAGVYKLTLDVGGTIEETTAQEAESIAKYIRHAIDSGMTVPRNHREIQVGQHSAVEARDFLIITRGKKRIDLFQQALDRYDLPCQVTGGNALLNVQPLAVLIECLRAIDDPHHPVHYLAILRDRLFAFCDAELYQFKRSGGRFSFTSDIPEDLPSDLKKRFADVHTRLGRYQVWLRRFPFSTAINRIASDLGLLAAAAAEREGNIALGGFFKAIEVLRQHSCDFDSAADVIAYLDQIEQLDETEACTARSPNPNVVRVMNLHKSKGLQAPVVFLTDTAAGFKGSPMCHVDRSGDEPVGYMGITAEKGQWASRDIATPANWKQFQDEEQRFLDAENDRLLYVATTRAACMLVVSQGKRNSSWSGLHPYLDSAAELDIPREISWDRATVSPKPASTSSLASESVSMGQRWADAGIASYAIESAKESALKGIPRATWLASGDYGAKWGSAIHELLDIAIKTPTTDLGAAALLAANRYELASGRVDEVVSTVQAVRQSEIWKRAQAATRCFSEIPFETFSTDVSPPSIVRGVIDLLFEEAGGWVLVDYKTDDIGEGDIAAAGARYANQLASYANHWQAATGFQVIETGLYFTRIDSYVTCGSGD